jgi:hypothetical protein
MVASLLRPLSSGLQNERITYAQPNFMQFLKVFVKAGRFTTQLVRLDFNQLPAFGTPTTVDLIRKGHFISRLFLVATLPDISAVQIAAAAAAAPAAVKPQFSYTNGIGHALIQNVEMTISGTVVERLNSRLLEALDEYNTPLEKVPAVDRLIGRLDADFSPVTGPGAVAPLTVRVPLPFWFTRGDSGCALPIDAMGSDLVQLRFNFRAFNGLFYTDSRSATPNPLVEGSALWPLIGSQLYKTDAAGSVVPGLDPNSPTQKYSPLTGYTMPTAAALGETYILAEYVYVDRPEANKFRLADLQIPVVQHYVLEPFDTQAVPQVAIPIRVPNPVRTLFIYPQRYEAVQYNAYFLATRDLAGPGQPEAPWWPNAVGLGGQVAPRRLIPAFSLQDSEPIAALGLIYEGNFARWIGQSPALFRSILPGSIYTKSPWINRYIYALPFGMGGPFSTPFGEANMDKLRRTDLRLQISPKRGCVNAATVDRFWFYIFAENYNILRVYGGRGSMLFSY